MFVSILMIELFLFFFKTVFLICVFWRGRKRRKRGNRISRKEMPIATTGHSASREPRVCSPDPVPKRADLCEDAGAHPAEYGGSEGGHSLGSFRLSGALESSSAASHSPPTSPFHHHHHHHHHSYPVTMEPPRTRSRSRSGFYHGGLSNSNGNAGSGGGALSPAGGISHHHHHHQQQQQQFGAAHGHMENLRPPGSMLSPGAHRHAGPGMHRNSGAGKTVLNLQSKFGVMDLISSWGWTIKVSIMLSHIWL